MIYPPKGDAFADRNKFAMKIDFANNEYRKYNNSASMYNQSLLEFKKWYNREHMPKSVPNMTY